MYYIQDIGSLEVSKNNVRIDNIDFKPSHRFWDSLNSKYGINASIFNNFGYKEVFSKISQKNPQKIRIAAQLNPFEDEPVTEFPKALAVSNPEKSIIELDSIIWALQQSKVTKIMYRDGILISRLVPNNEIRFCVNGDDDQLRSRFMLEVPVDGYSKSTVWPVYYRDHNNCCGALSASHKCNQSIINMGEECQKENFLRIIQTYNNEEAWINLKNRILTSQNSWASVLEVMGLTRLFWEMSMEDFNQDYLNRVYTEWADSERIISDVLRKLQDITGDVRAIYAISSIDSLSIKKQRILPTKASVYELLGFAARFSNNWLKYEAARRIDQYIGNILSTDFDLENSRESFPKFEDFLAERIVKLL